MDEVIRIFVGLFGVAMVAFGGHALVWARRRWDAGDAAAILVYAAFRFLIGSAAFWLALGGGAAAGWTMIVLILLHLLWRFALERRAASS